MRHDGFLTVVAVKIEMSLRCGPSKLDDAEPQLIPVFASKRCLIVLRMRVNNMMLSPVSLLRYLWGLNIHGLRD